MVALEYETAFRAGFPALAAKISKKFRVSSFITGVLAAPHTSEHLRDENSKQTEQRNILR